MVLTNFINHDKYFYLSSAYPVLVSYLISAILQASLRSSCLNTILFPFKLSSWTEKFILPHVYNASKTKQRNKMWRTLKWHKIWVLVNKRWIVWPLYLYPTIFRLLLQFQDEVMYVRTYTLSVSLSPPSLQTQPNKSFISVSYKY